MIYDRKRLLDNILLHGSRPSGGPWSTTEKDSYIIFCCTEAYHQVDLGVSHRSKVGRKGKGSICHSVLERMEPARSVHIRVDAEQAKEVARKYARIEVEVNCRACCCSVVRGGFVEHCRGWGKMFSYSALELVYMQDRSGLGVG